MSTIILEDSRATLINKSKSVDTYKNTKFGKNRWERKRLSKVANKVKMFNDLNMNTFVKQDTLLVNVPVQGETAEYTVSLQMEGVMTELQKSVKGNNNKFEHKNVVQALIKVFNTANIKVKCTCEDFCLHEDTKIKLLSGEVITVKELEKKFKESKVPLYVYSTDENGDFKPGKINDVWVSGLVDELIKVTLDNGKEVLTTPNHLYMLRTGEYVSADSLAVGDSLMPLYFSQSENGYETIKLNSEAKTKFYSTYKLVADNLLQDEINEAKIRTGEDKVAIHHKDFNKNNNVPENLYPMGFNEHYKYHYDHAIDSPTFAKFKAGGEKYRELVMDHSTPEYTKQADVMSKAIKKYYNNLSESEWEKEKDRRSKITAAAWENGSFDTEKCKQARIENAKNLIHDPNRISEFQKNYWASIDDEVKKDRINATLAQQWGWNKGKHLSDVDKQHKSNAWQNKSDTEKALIKLKRLEGMYLVVFNDLIKQHLSLTLENYNLIRKNHRGAPKIEKHFNSFKDAVLYFKLNHKIIKIEKIKLANAVPVYDIAVDKYHNFYVDSGVILHNCYHYAHNLIINNNSVDDSAHDPGPGTTGKTAEMKGQGCKHILLVLSNQDWVMKLASTISNYIKYIAANKKDLFMNIIFPKLYGISPDKAAENNLVQDEEMLDSSKDVINTINQWAVDKGKFKPGSNKNTATKDIDLEKEKSENSKKEPAKQPENTKKDTEKEEKK